MKLMPIFVALILLLFLGLLLPSVFETFQLADTSGWNATQALTKNALWAVPLVLIGVVAIYYVYQYKGGQE